MSALRKPVAIAQGSGRSGGTLARPRAERRDTIIASAVLVLLIAGWTLNFVSLKQLTAELGVYLAHALPRQA